MASQIGSRYGPYTSGASRFLAISYENTAKKGAYERRTKQATQIRLFHSINASLGRRAALARPAKVSVTMRLAEGPESPYTTSGVIIGGQHRLGQAARHVM